MINKWIQIRKLNYFHYYLNTRSDILQGQALFRGVKRKKEKKKQKKRKKEKNRHTKRKEDKHT